ncbi:MAG: class I SAM-dependent methyltransferase [Cyclobacteriaceae bacterium]|nr:class I SAM-dependent methyltransferase [Cyclobacteriaceae bacterium]
MEKHIKTVLNDLINILWTGSIAFSSIFMTACSQESKNKSEKPQNFIESAEKPADTAEEKPVRQPIPNFENLIKEFESPERVEWQNPGFVLEKLGDYRDKVIADIGSGTGYFTFPLAGMARRVIAIDIEEGFLNYIEDRKFEVSGEIADKIETRLTVEDDPALFEKEVDMVLMVNVFHYLSNRVDYLGKIKYGLNTGGRLLIVDFKAGDLPLGPLEEDKVPFEKALTELKKAGFNVIEADQNTLPYQYIIKAQKP